MFEYGSITAVNPPGSKSGDDFYDKERFQALISEIENKFCFPVHESYRY